METLINVINAMLDRTFSATMNEYFMVSTFLLGLMFAVLVFAVSVLRFGIQLFNNKARK